MIHDNFYRQSIDSSAASSQLSVLHFSNKHCSQIGQSTGSLTTSISKMILKKSKVPSVKSKTPKHEDVE